MASGFIWQMNIENYLKAGGLAKDQFSWLGGGYLSVRYQYSGNRYTAQSKYRNEVLEGT